MQQCEFINCGNSIQQQVILIESSESSLELIDSYFEFNSPSPAKPVFAKCVDVHITNCNFYKSSQIKIQIDEKSNALLLSSPEIAITQCTFDQCNGSPCNCFDISTFRVVEVKFTDSIICNQQINSHKTYSARIDLNNKFPELELRNISFVNNSCESQWGGGSGFVFNDISKITIINCSFINNTAKKSSTPRNPQSSMIYQNIGFDYYNGDGGAIQIGFNCFIKNSVVKIEDCIFSNNKASKHGGAIAIQTTNTVEIKNCTFNLNKADENLDSLKSILLAENHYNKKEKGRGGAIYINPTFSYTSQDIDCENSFDSYMTSITIEKCTFVSNSAYDGYAIYVEGEDLGTKFDFANNKFDDNYNFAESAKPDPNITVRGVIATEIHSIQSDVVLNNNLFENVHSKKLVYVDHYGTRIATNAFSESADFTYSKDFTKSRLFTTSAKFTKSNDFTKSTAFSNSDKFSHSNEFTKSAAFSNSDKFSHTSEFSKTELLSISNAFTESSEFSESQDILLSGKFTSTNYFSSSLSFSNSNKFTNSDRFTNSDGFSKSDKFTNSDRFSKSDNFLPSTEFTGSLSFSSFYESPQESSESSQTNEIEDTTIDPSSNEIESSTKTVMPVIPVTQTLSLMQTNEEDDPNISIKSGKNKKTALVIGLVVGLIVLVLIIILIIILIIRRKKQKDDQSASEVSKELSQVASNSTDGFNQEFINPLYQNENDPFLETYEEES